MTLTLDPTAGLDVATSAVARAVAAGADQAKALHTCRERYEVNFETRDITLVRTTVTDNLDLTVYSDHRRGSSEITGRSHDELDGAVAQALDAARAGQPDPANLIPEEAADPAGDAGSERPDEQAMVDAVLRYLERMAHDYPQLRSRDVSHYSFVSTWRSYANSAGRVQRARRGLYEFVAMVTGRDDTKTTSFNYVGLVSREPFSDLAGTPAVRHLVDGTVASFDPRPVPETFVGDVIFTPEAMSTITAAVVGALTGISLMRKATPYADQLGSQIASPLLTVSHRPSELPAAAAFDDEGFVNRDLPIIEAGVLENFLVDWYTSHKLGLPMTSGLADVVVAGGADHLDEIIAGTERGILLGRYSGGMPNQNLDFSGVAKNSFYVEDGKVKHALSETMVAGSFRAVLESIRAVSAETLDYGTARYPWVAATGVTVSTK